MAKNKVKQKLKVIFPLQYVLGIALFACSGEINARDIVEEHAALTPEEKAEP